MARAKKEDSINKELKELNIDKQTIVRTIKDEIKESLLEEISSRIEYETKDKLDKMEKRIYRYKKVAIRKRNIVILLLIIIIVFETKILYDNNLLPTLNNNIKVVDNQNNSPKKEEVKDSKWYLDNYSYLLNNVKTNLLDENSYYLYEGNYNETSIKNNVRLNMAYQLLNPNDIISTSSIITIKEDAIKKAYEKVFGHNDNYEPENFTNDCLQFIYNKNTSSYMAIDITCDKKNTEVLENITTIYEENDKIIIETIAGIYDKDNETLNNISNEKITDNFTNPNNLSSYKESLNKYKYIFKKIDDNYYLEEINKLN